MIAAIFNLNHPAHTVHWHFIDLSVSNVIVIVLNAGRVRGRDPGAVPKAREGRR